MSNDLTSIVKQFIGRALHVPEEVLVVGEADEHKMYVFAPGEIDLSVALFDVHDAFKANDFEVRVFGGRANNWVEAWKGAARYVVTMGLAGSPEETNPKKKSVYFRLEATSLERPQ